MALTQHHRTQPLIVPYVSHSLSLFFMLRIWVFSLSTHFSISCFLNCSFPAARLLPPPQQQHGFSRLQSSSLDSPRITWEKGLLCLLLLSIIASATPTTGFICWRRATFDTGASQAGLPLSLAQALFLVAEGAERVFDEIQTLGMRSHRHLKTLLPLTSVAMCGDQKNLEPSCIEEFCSSLWMHNDDEKTMAGLGENQGFLKDSNIPANVVNYRSIFALADGSQ